MDSLPDSDGRVLKKSNPCIKLKMIIKSFAGQLNICVGPR